MSMDAYCNRFRFAWDMNGDLAFTVSDVWLLVKAIFLLPATASTSVLHRFEATAVFFEIDCHTGQGIGGAIVSLMLWPWLALSIALLISMASDRK